MPAAAPAPAPAPMSEEAPKNAAYGTILGIVLIVAILVVGAFYIWGQRLEADKAAMPDENAAMDGGVSGNGGAEADVPMPQ